MLRLSIAALSLAHAFAGEFNFSAVFSNGMVLQRGKRAAIFGDGAPPGSTVLLRLEPERAIDSSGAASCALKADSVSTIAAADGSWKGLMHAQAPCPATNATPPTAKVIATLVHSNTSLQLTNVVFGDVYFCSGQSNMELEMHYTLHRNTSYANIRASSGANRYARNIRIFHFTHNPQKTPQYIVNYTAVTTPWKTAGDALADGTLDAFSAVCFYFGESLMDRLANSDEAIPIGLIESAFGGTLIESWVGVSEQFGCSNISCTANTTMRFTKQTADACLAGPISPKQPGANGQLYNGMVGPFVNYTIAGWVWYQGENNLFWDAGNVLDSRGYACMLRTLIKSWRSIWSAEPDTTDPNTIFGIVTLADSTDEGIGDNVPQMHWAETANMGYAPNGYLPNTFLATAHDLADAWDDGCMLEENGACCVDIGKPPDARCNLQRRGFLVSNAQFPGATEPTTPTRGLTIHPRVKKQIGVRLAQAAFSLYYGHPTIPWTGPVLSGCSIARDPSGKRTIVVRFNETLLFGQNVSISDYVKAETASVMWVKVDEQIPEDAAKNYLYAPLHSGPWWGDDSSWKNVNIQVNTGDGNSIILTDLPETGAITGIRYGHISPKGNPQNGHDKICCGNRDFKVDPCAPESCPIWIGGADPLPAMPFHAAIVDGKCKCFAPQTCEDPQDVAIVV